MGAEEASKTFGSNITLLAGTADLAVAIVVAAAMLAVAPGKAAARPQYAQQTGLPCGQCHQNPAGGGKLKPFGEKFRANGHQLPGAGGAR